MFFPKAWTIICLIASLFSDLDVYTWVWLIQSLWGMWNWAALNKKSFILKAMLTGNIPNSQAISKR